MGLSRPLLLGNVDIYRGSWVPLTGLEGVVHTEGVEDGDEIAIEAMTEEEVKGLVLVTGADRQVVVSPEDFKMVRAVRQRSSGSEVFVWVS